jgi:ABC-type histidine transport system ATPase subunit
MILVTAESLAKRFGDQVILNGVGFSIQDTDRIALVLSARTASGNLLCLKLL